MSMPPAPKKARRSQILDESVYCEEDETDSPYTMYFVRLTGVEELSDVEKRNHCELFRSLSTSGIMPEWVDADSVFEIPTRDDYFVVPVFRGPTFRRLCKEGFKVYGPPIVAECLQDQKPLPRWEHPVFSSVFEGATVCFTSIPPNIRKELSEKVGWMNGIVTDSLFRDVTHLVVGKADTSSKKYQAATRCGIDLMTSAWIEELWNNTQTAMGKFSAIEQPVVVAYKLPVFEGTIMTITKIEKADRTNLFRLVEDHGGKMLGTMTRNSCTHLVTDHLGSEKYKKATEWGNVKIVQVRWIRKCIDVGYLVDETKYHPKHLSNENMRSSTPQRDTTVHESLPDVSSISGPGGRLSVSMNTSSILTPTPLNNLGRMSRIFERPNNSSVVAATTIVAGADETMREGPSKTMTIKMSDPIDDLYLREDEDSDIFEGCIIWMCGVEPSKSDKWRRLLDRSGATRAMKIDMATHVVVVNASTSDKVQIRKYLTHPNIVIVTCQWIVECFRQKTLVPHEDYEWSENMGEDAHHIATTSASIQKRTNDESSPSSISRYSEEPPAKMKGIFAPFTFYVHRLVDDSVAEYQSRIRKNGGIVVDDEHAANYCVYSDMVPIDMIDGIRCGITTLYIDTCIRKERMLEISNHALFVVLPAYSKSIFAEYYFLLTTSSKQLMNFVTNIIRAHRGVVLDENDPRADEALIIMMERIDMNRVDVSRRKRMCDLSWIIESVTKGQIVSKRNHAFNGEPMSDYERDDELWRKCVKEKEPTEVLDRNFEEAPRSTTSSDLASEEKVIGFVNPHRMDMKQPYTMKLKYDEMKKIINEAPSPCRENTDDSNVSMSTTRIGEILKIAVKNTGRRESSEEKPRTKEQCESRRNTENIELDENRMMEVEEDFRLKYPIKPQFVLSVSDLPKNVVEQMRMDIVELGGVLNNDYNCEVTHLICAKMMKYPKPLSTIAAGKWCLIPDYIRKCKEAGRWLPEEKFEWNCGMLSEKASTTEKELARCCKLWRERIARMPITDSIRTEIRRNGAFSEWRCILFRDDKKALSLISILDAGGASVVTAADYLEIVTKRPNIVFMSKNFDWNPQSVAILKRERIPLVYTDYIYQYLVRDSFDKNEFLHPEFRGTGISF